MCSKLGDGDRLLLWHGSRSTNFAGILKQGLRIAPPEGEVLTTSVEFPSLTLIFSSRYWSVLQTLIRFEVSYDYLGYMFGKGVYFADVCYRYHGGIILIIDSDNFLR